MFERKKCKVQWIPDPPMVRGQTVQKLQKWLKRVTRAWNNKNYFFFLQITDFEHSTFASWLLYWWQRFRHPKGREGFSWCSRPFPRHSLKAFRHANDACDSQASVAARTGQPDGLRQTIHRSSHWESLAGIGSSWLAVPRCWGTLKLMGRHKSRSRWPWQTTQIARVVLVREKHPAT